MTYRRVEILKVCLSIMLEKLVHDDPSSLDELAEVAGVHKDIVRKHLKPLMNRQLVHIAEWRRSGRNQHWIPLYSFTIKQKKSVPRPRNMTASERAANSKERLKRKKELELTNLIAIKPKKEQNEIGHASISDGQASNSL